MHRTDLIHKFIIACCVLQNICLLEANKLIADADFSVENETFKDNAYMSKDKGAFTEGRILTSKKIKPFRDNFYSDKRNIQALNVAVKSDPMDLFISRKTIETTDFIFQHKLDEGKPITNQMQSGTCWIFAALNAIRIPFMKQYNLTEFEFSQSYLYFWDQIEKSNRYLHKIVRLIKTGETIDSELISELMLKPIEDGGLWIMIVDLINRYGLIPKKSFPESWTSKNSSNMMSMLKSKLLEYSKILVSLIKDGANDRRIEEEIQKQMTVIFRLVSICFGIPPETIIWEYYDDDDKYHRIGPITPLDFYRTIVKPYYNIDNKVYVYNDPRPSHPFGQLYEKVDTIYESGRKWVINNQPIKILMNASADSILHDEAVVVTCDISKRVSHNDGILDTNIYDVESVFGTDLEMFSSKAERVRYRESYATHAVVLTGVSFDSEKKVEKFRVENSWGDSSGNHGYEVMTARWFEEFVFSIVVDKKYLSKKVLKVLKQTPIPLKAWDVMMNAVSYN